MAVLTTTDQVDRDLAELASLLDQIRVRARVQKAGEGEAPPPSEPDQPDFAARAKRLYRDRRRRADVFGGDHDLFGEPAWDILLDLYIAAAEKRDVRIGDSCVAAAVPKTTALRWLGTLTERGLVERLNDRGDARSSIIRLTDKGGQLIRSYLAQTLA